MDKLDIAKTALVLIDLQEGILGSPTAPHSVDTVVANSRRLADRFRAASAPVVLVTVGWTAGGADGMKQEVDMPSVRPGGFPANFADLVPGIGRTDTDIVINKRQWGAFYGTELDLQLRRRGVTTIVLGGVATSLGVESTARSAWEHGYTVVFAEDATSSYDPEMHAFAFGKIFPRLGLIRSTDQVLGLI